MSARMASGWIVSVCLVCRGVYWAEPGALNNRLEPAADDVVSHGLCSDACVAAYRVQIAG